MPGVPGVARWLGRARELMILQSVRARLALPASIASSPRATVRLDSGHFFSLQSSLPLASEQVLLHLYAEVVLSLASVSQILKMG